MPYPYRNPTLSVERRAAALLDRMTFDEKIAQMHAFWLILSEDGRHEVRTDGFTGATDPDTLKRMLSFGLGQITRPLGSRPIEPADGVGALQGEKRDLLEFVRDKWNPVIPKRQTTTRESRVWLVQNEPDRL